jgi:hypothetical protein
MDINEWDRIWKEIQIDTEGRLYTSANILDHWKKIPDKAYLRKGWPSMDDKPHIRHLGYRKTSKPGKESVGEKGIERRLLGDRGKVKIHYLENGDESLRLQVSFHNMGLGTARGPSQKIIDCFGVIDIGNKHFATAIEVKVDNERPWYAVIENLIQVQMLKANLENLQQYFGNPPLSFGTLSDALGIVIAPEPYFKSTRIQNSFKRALDLIEDLHDQVKITLVACDGEPAGGETASAESRLAKDAYWRLSYFGGFWPSKTETLNPS